MKQSIFLMLTLWCTAFAFADVKLDHTNEAPDIYLIDCIAMPNSEESTISISATQHARHIAGKVKSKIEYRLSRDSIWSEGNDLLYSNSFTVGKPNEPKSVKFTFTPKEYMKDKTWYILIKCDATDETAESDEKNNVKFLSIYIGSDKKIVPNTLTTYGGIRMFNQYGRFGGFDIYLKNCNARTNRKNSTVMISVEQYSNQINWSKSKSEYRISNDKIWSKNDKSIGKNFSIVGEEIKPEKEIISWSIPTARQKGTFYILIKCDATDEYKENDEKNNVAIITVTDGKIRGIKYAKNKYTGRTFERPEKIENSKNSNKKGNPRLDKN